MWQDYLKRYKLDKEDGITGGGDKLGIIR
jgi:hypothetical protein